MISKEKKVTYSTSNTYSTLNALTDKTKTIWFVCHGMGYLSRYFLRYFKEFDAEENYFIAPQAPSKYYIPPKFKYVGASWLTKENTIGDTTNIMSYFDAIFKAEELPDSITLNVLGYSQGVSVAMRYVASRKIKCSKLFLMSGGIPKELQRADFEFLDARYYLIYGTEDEFLDEKRIAYERERFHELFEGKGIIKSFEGNHKFESQLLLELT